MGIKRFCAIALLLAATVGTKAEWIDVTDNFIVNPRFDNNSSMGWSWSSNAGSQTANYGCFEFWNGTFDFFQDIFLQKGHYRLSVQGYYRCGDYDAIYQDYLDGKEQVNAFLYAGDVTKPLASPFSFSFGRRIGGCWSPDNQSYYPNNMESASNAFANGAYLNTIEFTLEEDRNVSLGVMCQEWNYSNWCIFDNFKLEYEGEIVKVSEVKVGIDKPEMIPGEIGYCYVEILPENALLQNVSWTSSNSNVASVDEYGKVCANSVGTAIITATTIDGSNLSASATVRVVSDTYNWVDITDVFVENPRFDNNQTTGWNIGSNASSQTANFECFEFWNGWFFVKQELENMPSGKYKLSVQAFYRTGDNNVAYDAYQNGREVIPAELFALIDSRPLQSVYSYSFDDYVNDTWSPFLGNGVYPNGMSSAAQAFANGAYNNSIVFDYVNDGYNNLPIGLMCIDGGSSNWCCFDNFKLEYCGDVVKATAIDVTAEKQTIIISETTQCTATITPDNTLIKDVVWTSANPNVATVDQNGLVTGIGSGSTEITATTTDGSNLSASVTINVTYGGSDENAIIINEIMASNVDEFVSPAFNFDGWIELYNTSANTIKLEGIYISDDQADLTKWKMPVKVGVLPARGYKVIWFDSNSIAQENAPFKLDVDGGSIFISNDGKNIIAKMDYPEGMERVSYARTTDAGETWGYTAMPSPGKSNNASVFAQAQLETPVVDQPSQLFVGPISVNVNIPAGATLRYTTDGSLPTMTNGQTSTTGQFAVSETASYRFRLFADGMLPSKVTTRSYIFADQDYTLPVVSVVSDQRFLYDDSLGVYVKGKNGRPGNGQPTKCNWNMDWERPVNFSYLDANGEMVLNQDVDLEMCGGWSRAWSPHAFKLKGNKEFGGNKNLPYQFFEEKPYIRNRTLQIRNGGNDTQCRILDPALQFIMQTSGMDMDVQSYQPVHEFINGRYIGVLNVREPNNKHYVYANYGWDDDEIDQFEMSPDSGYVQKCGTPDVYIDLVDNLSENAASGNTYNEICNVLDVDEYAAYMATQFYLGNWDWPQNNVKGFRHKDNGRFRFVMFDLDGSFSSNDPINGFMNKEWYTFDQLYPTTLGRVSDQIRFVTLFRNMLNNEKFRKKFIDTYCIVAGSVFDENRVTGIINDLVKRVNPAMRLEGGAADNTANRLKQNLSNRNDWAMNALKNYWPLDLFYTNAQKVSLSSDTENAAILVNGIKVPTGQFSGGLFQPVTLRAVAPAGYEFLGWASNVANQTAVLAAASTWKYYDQGSLDNTNWTSPSYAENGWKSGKAPLGYGKGNLATTISYGNDGNNKRPTAYFRTNVNFEKAPKSTDKITLNFTVDDGFIIYVNGAEAGRYNMPSGNVNYNTYSTTYAPGNPDSGTISLSPGHFHSGNNVIAVEVHNNSASSTDLMWEASITTSAVSQPSSFYSTNAEITLPDGDVSLVACYREMTQQEKDENAVHPVAVNEVSGSNNALVNEYGKKNDWVELYNTTDEAIDLEGMYLTDNIDKLQKYQITKGNTNANTVIPAHGHLIIWCDQQQTTDVALHASFKISGSGGLIALTSADNSWTDVLYYGAHDGNSTVGRFPDGASSVYLMNIPTIEKANILSSYVTEVEQKDPDGIRNVEFAAANGLRSYYTSQFVNVKSEDALWAKVDIYSSDGRIVEQQTAKLNHGVAKVSVAHLPQGFYVAKVADNMHNKVACKFVKY